jgi:hypothetical protein
METMVTLAELTAMLGLPEHEQSAVASFTGEPYGTEWTLAEAREICETWAHTDPATGIHDSARN